MAVQNKDCYKVVTIGYLKSFIGTNIQNSSGAVVYVNTNVLASEKRRDDYCPTYSELTGGTLIPNWAQGGTPNGDRDGITVSNPWFGSEPGSPQNYANNQLVDQKDLGLRYTRFLKFSVSSASGDISQCGGNKSVSYVHQYTRYNKSMNSSCAVSTTSATANDTENTEVTWTGCNWISVNRSTLVATAVRQPETRKADRRCCSVKGQITFRATSHTASTSICQAALGGGWNNYEGRHYTSVTVHPSTTSTFGCDGGSFSVTSTGYFYDRYEWKDDCGTIYHSSPYDDRNGSEAAGTASGSFDSLECDCESAQAKSKTLTINYHGSSDSATFNQSCAACPDDPKCNPCEGHEVTIDYDKEPSCTGGTVTFCIDGSCKEPEPSDCVMEGPDSVTIGTSETSGSFDFVSKCNTVWANAEVSDKGALDTATVVYTGGVNGRIDFTWNSTSPGDTTITLKQENADGTLTVEMHKTAPIPTSSVTINCSGIGDNVSSGALNVTGSTYTATFTIAGPNYGKGTLYGTLTADQLSAMTFSGNFDGGTYHGGTIKNECPGTPGNIFHVISASWNVSTKKLTVTIAKCSS